MAGDSMRVLLIADNPGDARLIDETLKDVSGFSLQIFGYPRGELIGRKAQFQGNKIPIDLPSEINPHKLGKLNLKY